MGDGKKREGFTPGPWGVQPHSKFEKSFRITGPEGVVIDYDDVDHDRQDADARLIAASPDLYEALKDMLELVDDLTRRQAHPAVVDTGVNAARAALSKARGES